MYEPGDLPTSTMRCVNVTIIDDDIVESDETFNIILSSDDPGVEISSMLSEALAVIGDDDRKSTITHNIRQVCRSL